MVLTTPPPALFSSGLPRHLQHCSALAYHSDRLQFRSGLPLHLQRSFGSRLSDSQSAERTLGSGPAPMDGKENEGSSEFADGADVLASFIAAADTDTAVKVLNRAALSITGCTVDLRKRDLVAAASTVKAQLGGLWTSDVARAFGACLRAFKKQPEVKQRKTSVGDLRDGSGFPRPNVGARYAGVRAEEK